MNENEHAGDSKYQMGGRHMMGGVWGKSRFFFFAQHGRFGVVFVQRTSNRVINF